MQIKIYKEILFRSPYIFFICGEILAIRIRKNNKFKGVLVGNTEIKISQLAEGTPIILNESKESLLETFDILKNVLEKSGLQINFSKTHTVLIGSQNIVMKFYFQIARSLGID